MMNSITTTTTTTTALPDPTITRSLIANMIGCDHDDDDQPQAEEEEQRHPFQSPNTTHRVSGHPTLMHATSTPPCGWEPSTSNQEMYVPLAETWHYNRSIKNRHGHTIFSLLQEEQIGRLIQSSQGEPILRMIIGDTNRQVVAVIVREARHGMDGYAIYGPRSAAESLFGDIASQYHGHRQGSFLNHPLGSLRHFHRDDEHHPTYTFRYHPAPGEHSNNNIGDDDDDDDDAITLELYLIATVVQGVLGKTYTVTSPDKKSIRWKAENGHFRKMLLCCPWCIVMGICMWQFEFHDLNITERQSGICSYLRRSCNHRRRQIAPGISSSRESVLSPERQEEEALVLVRDQEIRTVEVAEGASPLLALCVSYAMDRLTRPLL